MEGYKFCVYICVETNVSCLFEGNISKFARTAEKFGFDVRFISNRIGGNGLNYSKNYM